MKIRGLDCHGSGAWQAPRGHRKHNGVDVVCEPGDKVSEMNNEFSKGKGIIIGVCIFVGSVFTVVNQYFNR